MLTKLDGILQQRHYFINKVHLVKASFSAVMDSVRVGLQEKLSERISGFGGVLVV